MSDIDKKIDKSFERESSGGLKEYLCEVQMIEQVK